MLAACGVAGRSSPARKFFKHVLEWDDNRDWVLSAQAAAAHLNSLVEDLMAFRQTITENVFRTRQLVKLSNQNVVLSEESL
jgi:hypothetical protein